MELQGHRGPNNPKIMLSSQLRRREKLQDELRSVEKQTEELKIGREDGKSDMVQSRPKGGGLATTSQGKPKKGRTGQRDVKKIRISSDVDGDDEDDVDTT